MNRKEFQSLTVLRTREAKILLRENCYAGAYYLTGYAIECVLKACIAKQVKKWDFPDKKLAVDSHTHNIEVLLKLAGLSAQHSLYGKGNSIFQVNWAIVKDWSEVKRYESNISQQEAKDLFSAVNDSRYGILKWIKGYW